jgi:PAS domain-containing protein
LQSNQPLAGQPFASELLALSKDRTPEGRNRLFRHVADLFLNHRPATSPAHQDDLVSILTMLRPKVDIRVRRELAATLYSMTSPPLPLVRLLMNDVEEVAGPLLRHAPLTADAIRILAPDAGPEARRRLLVRPDLPADIRAQWQQSAGTAGQAAATAEPTPPLPPASDKASALRQQRNRFQDMVRAATDWQWETDRNGVLTFISDSAVRAFERPVSYMVGAPLMDLVTAEGTPHQPDPLNHTLARLRPFDNLIVRPLARALAEQRWQLAGVPVFDRESGRFMGYRGTAQSVSHFNNPLAAAPPGRAFHAPAATPRPPAGEGQAGGLDPTVMAALQTLSHEIRTPLNAILGFSEIVALGTRGPLDDRYRRSAQEAVAAGWHLNKVISHILECAPLLSGKRPPNANPNTKMVSLVQTVRSVLTAVAEEAAEKSVSLAIAPDSVSPVIQGDSAVLTMCLTNLLRRAVLESAAGSQIQVTIRTEQRGSVEIVVPVPKRDPKSENSPLSKLYQFFAEELAVRLSAHIKVSPASGQSQSLSLYLPLAETQGTSAQTHIQA